jgi:hypothetical protein
MAAAMPSRIWMALPLGEHFAEQGQHGGVGEMKQDGADQKDSQPTILQDGEHARRLASMFAVVSAARGLVVDPVRVDRRQGTQGGQSECDDEKEDSAV